jgi:hypothetical protein
VGIGCVGGCWVRRWVSGAQVGVRLVGGCIGGCWVRRWVRRWAGSAFVCMRVHVRVRLFLTPAR